MRCQRDATCGIQTQDSVRSLACLGYKTLYPVHPPLLASMLRECFFLREGRGGGGDRGVAKDTIFAGSFTNK